MNVMSAFGGKEDIERSDLQGYHGWILLPVRCAAASQDNAVALQHYGGGNAPKLRKAFSRQALTDTLRSRVISPFAGVQLWTYYCVLSASSSLKSIAVAGGQAWSAPKLT
jgi:hypothetical protein